MLTGIQHLEADFENLLAFTLVVSCALCNGAKILILSLDTIEEYSKKEKPTLANHSWPTNQLKTTMFYRTAAIFLLAVIAVSAKSNSCPLVSPMNVTGSGGSCTMNQQFFYTELTTVLHLVKQDHFSSAVAQEVEKSAFALAGMMAKKRMK